MLENLHKISLTSIEKAPVTQPNIYSLGNTQRRLDPGKETLEGFFQVGNQKEYQNVVIISFVHLEKVNIFCFMHKSVAQKLSLPCPFENQTLNGHKSVNFKARDFSFWI